MITIWKYKLRFKDIPSDNEIITGPFLRVLSVAKTYEGNVHMWCEVDTDLDRESYRELSVAICGTGQPKPGWIGDAFKFLGSVVDNSFIWHIYVKGVPIA